MFLMHWSRTKFLTGGADFLPRARGNTPKHKQLLPPPEMCTSLQLLFECDFASKMAGRKEGENALCGKKKGLMVFKATASRQRKTKRRKFSQLTFLIPTLPLLLKCWCWLGTPAVENYTGSVTSLSPLLEHQYRAAYGERKTSIKKKTVAREYLVVICSLSIWKKTDTKNITPMFLNLYL